MSKRTRLLQKRLSRLRELRGSSPALFSRAENKGAPKSAPKSAPTRGVALSLRPRPKRSRTFWFLTPLVLVALLFCAWRFVVVPQISLNLEGIVRAQLVPELQKQIGAPVEIGRIESDYVSRVTLHDVVIGRGAQVSDGAKSDGAKTPFGALARAKQIDLELDIVSLALRRSDATRALRRVLVQSPQIFLERDRRGLNWTRLWKAQPSSQSSRTHALIQIQNARLFYRDTTVRDRQNRALQAVSKFAAWVQMRGDDAAVFKFNAPQTRIGARIFQNVGVFYVSNKIALRGEVAPDATWFSSGFDVPSLAVALPIEYSNRVQTALGRLQRGRGEVAVRGQIAWQKPAPNRDFLSSTLWTGEVRARGVDLEMTGNWPRTNRVAQIQNVNGVIAVEGRTLQSSALRLTALETPFSLRGAVSFNSGWQPQALDVLARSERIDLARLWPFFAPNTRQIALRSGLSQGALHLKGALNKDAMDKGTANRLQIGGEFSVPRFAFSLAASRTTTHFQSDFLRVSFQSDAELQSGTTRFSLAGAQFQNHGTKANRVFVRSNRATQGGSIWKGSATWNRAANGTLRVLDAALDAPQLAAQARAWVVSAQDVKARLGWRDGRTTVQWQTRHFVGRGRLNSEAAYFSAKLFDGQVAGKANFATQSVALNNATNNLIRDATVRFFARDVSGQAARWGRGRVTTARGEVSWRAANGVMPLQTNIALQDLQGYLNRNFVRQLSVSTSPRSEPDHLESVRLHTRALRLLLATTNASARRAVWNGAATWDNFGGESLRSLLPASFRARLRDVGTLDGRARFWNLGGSSPVANGDFSLSSATVDTYRLRALRGRLSLDGDVLVLRQGRAQSEAGTLLLDAQLDLRSGTNNLKNSLELNVPNVLISGELLDPLLAATGVHLDGAARGTLRVSTRDFSSPNFGSPNSVPTTFSFDLSSARARLASRVRNDDRVKDNRVLASDNVLLRNLRLRGQGTLQRGAKGLWLVSGQVQIEASEAQVRGTQSGRRVVRIGAFSLPSWTRGAGLENLVLAVQGRVRLGGAPQIAELDSAVSLQKLALPTQLVRGDVRGRLRVSRAVLPMANVPLQNRRVSFGNQLNNIVAQNIDAPWTWDGEEWRLPRLVGQLPQLTRLNSQNSKQNNRQRMATVVAQSTIRNGAWSGEVLARDLDASRLQRWSDVFLRDENGTQALWNRAAVRGTAFVRANFSAENTLAKTSNARFDVRARLYNGALSVPFAASSTRSAARSQVKSQDVKFSLVPLDAALARFSYAMRDQTARLNELKLWSRGARFFASGNLLASQDGSSGSGGSSAQSLDFDVQMNNVRVRDLQNALQIQLPSQSDGVLSGAFRVAGTTQTPRAVGRATLRLARLGDVALDEATSQVRWENSPTGTRLALSEIVARSNRTTIQGDAVADTRRDVWRANLSLSDAPASQLLRVVEAVSSSENDEVRLWPLRGDVRANIQLSGDFGKRDLAGVRLADARVDMQSPALRWRGRELGALTAGLNLRDGVLQIEDAALVRSLSADEIALLRAQKVVSSARRKADTTTGENATNDDATSDDATSDDAMSYDSTSDNSVNDVSEVRLSGEIPLGADKPLQVGVRVENERLSVLRDLLMETQRGLREYRQSFAVLDQVASSTRSLPTGLEARVDATAQISGERQNPRIALNLTVDHARLEAQQLPQLETSLVFADGAIEVDNLELKQAFLEDEDVNEDAKPRLRETALRVAPGGRIVLGGEVSLDVEVLRANLSQLAQWVPFLRDQNGAPSLNGELSLFSFEVRGQSSSPEIVGSVEARDVAIRGTTFDRLRVTTFQIKDEMLTIEPGDFTVVKGGFQSSAAYGSVPWSWGAGGKPIGPRRDGALDVHLPLQTRDFGALSGAFVPALTNVSADEFKGSLDITGTLDDPQIAGALSFQNARFRVDPAVGPFPFGIDRLSGGVRFVDGNRVLVENLRGVLQRADEVQALSTGNPSAAERDANAARREESARRRGVEMPHLAGDFVLGGEVVLDLDPRRLTNGLRLASHRYDLTMSLKNGAMYASTYSGLRDVSLDATWKTGDGDPRRAQQMTWTMNARGRNSLSRNLGREARGALNSRGEVRLAANFASGLDALLRSKWDGDVTLKDLPWQMRDVGRTVVNGELKLDNGTTARERNRPQIAPLRQASTKTQSAVKTQASAKQTSAKIADDLKHAASSIRNIHSPRSTQGTTRLADGTTVMPVTPRSFAQIIENTQAAQTPSSDDSDDLGYEDAPFPENDLGAAGNAGASVSSETINQNENPPLRIAGDLTLSQTEVTGLPTSEGTGVSSAISAPFFDVRLQLGRDVRFTTSTLRAELEGELDLTGTPRQPRLVGVVSTRNGQMRFPSATARIEEGEISIDVSRDAITQQLRSRATIDATARGQVGRYQITIALRGPLDLGGNRDEQNLRVEVTSNPPLSQDEAFAQLTGTSVRETTSETNESYARAVVNLLSAPLFSGLERTLEEALGLNSLTLDYRLDEPIGVQLGKALGDRVFVTYRRSLTRGNTTQPAYSLRVDFRIKGNVQVGAQVDERGRKQLTIEKTIRF